MTYTITGLDPSPYAYLVGLSDAELNRCLFFRRGDDEPWIPPDLLQAIARQVGGFNYVGVTWNRYIDQLDQVVWNSVVIDDRERTFERSGVATRGEKPNDIEIDTNTLASGRALSAALTAAGFNPFKAGSVELKREAEPQNYSGPEKPVFPSNELLRDGDQPSHEAKVNFDRAQAAELRGKDLRQIHKLAADCGLIVGKDMRSYRAWLVENYDVNTAAVMDGVMRASVINALMNYADDIYLAGVPQELRADAAIA